MYIYIYISCILNTSIYSPLCKQISWSRLTAEITPAALACPGEHSQKIMNREGHEGPQMPAEFQTPVSSRSSRVHSSKNVSVICTKGAWRQTVQVTPCRLAMVSRWNSSTEWLPPAAAAVSWKKAQSIYVVSEIIRISVSSWLFLPRFLRITLHK